MSENNLWPPHIASGQTIGPYQLIRMIYGAPSSGCAVWEAIHDLHKVVAVKFVNPIAGEFYRNYGDLLLQQEIRILRLLSEIDPGIAPYFIEGECFWQPRYLVMNYLNSDNLSVQTLKTSGGYRWDGFQLVAAEMCLRLSALHRAGFVHNDIKPSNYVVEFNGQVTLIDYGLCMASAPIIDRVNPAPPPLTPDLNHGSPAYAAPERFQGLATAPAADVYALGCTLFESLTGRLPFSGNLDEIRAQHNHEAPPEIGKLAVVPAETARAIMACFEKLPDNRPSLEELTAACQVRLWTSRKYSNNKPAGKCVPAGSTPLITSQLLFVAATVLVAFVFLSHNYGLFFLHSFR